MNDIFSTRLTREYGTRYPFVGAGMGFVAHERLAAAVTNAGGIGFLGAAPDPPESLAIMVDRVRRLTDGPFGVDFICADLPTGPSTTDAHIDQSVALGVGLVAFHHDLPPARWVDRLHAAGARVWMQVSSLMLASHAVELGIDGIVVQGVEAGGHNRSAVPLPVLLSQVREQFPEQLLLAAGGITTGDHVAAALRGGADGVWVGTRLVASDEAYAHSEYKRRLVKSTGETRVTTAFGPEWPGQLYRLLATDLAKQWAGRESEIPSPPPGPGIIGTTRLFPHTANLEYSMPKFSAFIPTPDTQGDWDEMAFPAGMGVGSITRIQPAGEIVREMMAQAARQLQMEPLAS